MRKLKSTIFSTALPVVFLQAFFLIFTSCDDSENSRKTRTYVGGEIVNPTSTFIIFKNNEKVLDTVYLDAQNRFSYEIDNPQQGLYTIEHRPETQHFYLTPGDSLLLRVNTLAFDESLHFSGRRDAENNFLAEMYLLDESNADLLLSFYNTDPSDFKKKTDSIRTQRLEELDRKKKKFKFSNEYTQLAEKIIKYESFDLQERYIYLFNKYRKGSSEALPADFDDYRKEARFNEKMLQSSPGYRRFIDNYLINRSFKWCARQAFDYNDCYSITDAENIKSRINMVDDLIQLPSLRKHFLTKLASLGITMAKSREEILDIIELVESVGFSEEGVKDLKQLGSIQLAYLPGTTLTNVALIDAEGNTRLLEDIIDNPTIVFLWSIYSNQHQKNHERIAELRKKYPEIDFIGVNLDVGEVPSWRIAVNKYDYNKDYEYQLGPTRIEKRFFKFFFNKLLFLDASGKVIIGDAFINSPNLENRILEFLNR